MTAPANASATNHSQQRAAKSRPPQQRFRASVACAACRARRTKCVMGDGQIQCKTCQRKGLTCVVPAEDKRKRPTNKAYVNTLRDRIGLLESMLPGQCVTQQSNPPSAQTEGFNAGCLEAETYNTNPQHSSRSSSEQDHDSPSSASLDFGLQDFSDLTIRRPSESPAAPELLDLDKDLVDRITSTAGHLSYDESTGRLRYFGPTTNFHFLHRDICLPDAMSDSHSWQQNKRSERVLRGLPQKTHDYLMDLYWTHFNSVLIVVEKDAFCEDIENGSSTGNYSGFLHICMLAMGCRFADCSRPDIKRLFLEGRNRECILHREAKHLLEYELESPGGLPSIQALLILGDLECAVGRDNTGWMYVGMACRMAFDFGLNLPCTQIDLSDREVHIRHMVLWACVVYDRYWALYFGRPTTIKTSDLAIPQLVGEFSRLSTTRRLEPKKPIETFIYEALLRLMNLLGRITESSNPSDAAGFIAMTSLDRELNSWYLRLPEPLKWRRSNIETAPPSFFLFHQQYYCGLILLHRPFARFESDDAMDEDVEDEQVSDYDHFSSVSRKICFDSAIRVARIFRYHTTRFNASQVFITGLQHAGIAATALIAGISRMKNPNERIGPYRHLKCLADILKVMGTAYQAAEKMSEVLYRLMDDSGWTSQALQEVESPASIPTTGPTRRVSEVSHGCSTAMKVPLTSQDGHQQSGPIHNLHSSSTHSSESFMKNCDQRNSTASTTSFSRPGPNGAGSSVKTGNAITIDNDSLLLEEEDGFLDLADLSNQDSQPGGSRSCMSGLGNPSCQTEDDLFVFEDERFNGSNTTDWNLSIQQDNLQQHTTHPNQGTKTSLGMDQSEDPWGSILRQMGE